jgi:glycosyltransferase involved in cell wall biosynthesis
LEAPSSPQNFVMMYHGTLTKLYGLDIAIEAFAIAHETMPGAELWILGGGPESPMLKSLADERGLGDKVKLIGMVPPADIPAWLDKSSVGLLPIRRDVFLEFASPNKLPEYIIMGKAVVVSRLKAIRHYFSENGLAFCEPNDPGDLAKQMIRLYSDKGLRDRLAAIAREEYAPIRWEVMKKRYLNLIEELTEPKIYKAEISGDLALTESGPKSQPSVHA